VKVVLRPVGRGNWRPLVLTVDRFPRRQGVLFRGNPWSADSIDADKDLAKVGDVWTLGGRKWRVAEVR
jgi:hypothetical protein